MTILHGESSPTPDRQSQRLYLMLVIVGMALAVVAWLQFFR